MGSLTPGWDSARFGKPKDMEEFEEGEEENASRYFTKSGSIKHGPPPLTTTRSLQRRSMPLEVGRQGSNNKGQMQSKHSLDHSDSWWRRMDCGMLNENPDTVPDKAAFAHGAFVPQYNVTGQTFNYRTTELDKEEH